MGRDSANESRFALGVLNRHQIGEIFETIFQKPLTTHDSSGKIVMDIRSSDSEVEKWITVNKTPIRLMNGDYQGEIGEKIAAEENMDYAAINSKIDDLKSQGTVDLNIGTAKPPVAVKIESASGHSRKHGVTIEEAQGFVDNAVVMFDQVNRYLYVSNDGNAVVLDKVRRLITAYRKDKFDVGITAILEVMKNG